MGGMGGMVASPSLQGPIHPEGHMEGSSDINSSSSSSSRLHHLKGEKGLGGYLRGLLFDSCPTQSWLILL